MHVPALLTFLTLTIYASALNLSVLQERKTSKGQVIADVARKQIGKPYVWGGGNCKGATGGGFDCSGLNLYTVCDVVGTELPHHAQTQYTDHVKYSGRRIDLKDAEPGDMYFYSERSDGDCSSGVSHTNICSKIGYVVNAPSTGRDVAETKTWSKSGDLTRCPYAIRFWD